MLELDDNDLFSPENSQSAGMQSAHRPPIKLLTDEEIKQYAQKEKSAQKLDYKNTNQIFQKK
jgi:hypothetical protein